MPYRDVSMLTKHFNNMADLLVALGDLLVEGVEANIDAHHKTVEYKVVCRRVGTEVQPCTVIRFVISDTIDKQVRVEKVQ